MKFFWSALLSNIVAALLVPLLYNQNNSKKANQIYYSSMMISVLLGTTLLMFLGVAYGVWRREYVLIPTLAIVGGLLLGVTIRCASWRIVFLEDSWVFKRKKYLYSDITRIVVKRNGNYSIFVKNKKITIDPAVVNYDAFTKMLKKQKVFKNAEIIQKK